MFQIVSNLQNFQGTGGNVIIFSFHYIYCLVRQEAVIIHMKAAGVIVPPPCHSLFSCSSDHNLHSHWVDNTSQSAPSSLGSTVSPRALYYQWQRNP